MISLKECKTCEVEGQYNDDEVYCLVCGDELIPLVAVKAADELAALNARVEELENAVELTLEWCGEDLPDDVKKELRNVLKGAE